MHAESAVDTAKDMHAGIKYKRAIIDSYYSKLPMESTERS